MQVTCVLLEVWRDVEIFGCSSLSAAVSVDGILLGFCSYHKLLNLYLAPVLGRTSNEFHNCSNTCPSLAEML